MNHNVRLIIENKLRRFVVISYQPKVHLVCL